MRPARDVLSGHKRSVRACDVFIRHLCVRVFAKVFLFTSAQVCVETSEEVLCKNNLRSYECSLSKLVLTSAFLLMPFSPHPYKKKKKKKFTMHRHYL